MERVFRVNVRTALGDCEFNLGFGNTLGGEAISASLQLRKEQMKKGSFS